MKNIAAVYPANCHPRGCGLASRVNRLESVRGSCEHWWDNIDMDEVTLYTVLVL